MIHLLTVHRGSRWVEIQLAYLKRHLREPYEVWASVQEVPNELATSFDHAIPMAGEHAGKLNLLWRHVEEHADDDDIVVFLDSDTLLVGDPMPLIRRELERNTLVAVQRAEDGGDPHPHPCFAAARAGTWRALRCDWSAGYLWRTTAGGFTTDVGSNLLYELERRRLPWLPLRRMNTVDRHPVLFGVYGGVVYHHGAGSRRFPLNRPESIEMHWRTSRISLFGFVLNVPVAMRRRLRMRKNRRMSHAVFEQLLVDPEFWRQFVPDAEGDPATLREG